MCLVIKVDIAGAWRYASQQLGPFDRVLANSEASRLSKLHTKSAFYVVRQ